MDAETRPLDVDYADLWLLNARVRDNQPDPDFRWQDYRLSAQDVREAPSVNPAALARKIIIALAAFEAGRPTALDITLDEAWYLERRFRHNDPEPAARALIKRVHAVILEFVLPSLPKWMEEAIDAAAEADTNADAHQDADERADTGPGAGATA